MFNLVNYLIYNNWILATSLVAKFLFSDREEYREGKVKSGIIPMKRFWILMLKTGKAICFTVPFV